MVDFSKLGSEIALEEDILREPPKFINTWTEWSVQNRSQVIVDENSIANETTTMFTVGKGERMWLTVASVMISCAGLNDSLLSGISIQDTGGTEVDIIRMSMEDTSAVSQTDEKVINFIPPLLIREGQSIVSQHNESAGANARSHFFILGWREPKPIV